MRAREPLQLGGSARSFFFCFVFFHFGFIVFFFFLWKGNLLGSRPGGNCPALTPLSLLTPRCERAGVGFSRTRSAPRRALCCSCAITHLPDVHVRPLLSRHMRPGIEPSVHSRRSRRHCGGGWRTSLNDGTPNTPAQVSLSQTNNLNYTILTYASCLRKSTLTLRCTTPCLPERCPRACPPHTCLLPRVPCLHP